MDFQNQPNRNSFLEDRAYPAHSCANEWLKTENYCHQKYNPYRYVTNYNPAPSWNRTTSSDSIILETENHIELNRACNRTDAKPLFPRSNAQQESSQGKEMDENNRHSNYDDLLKEKERWQQSYHQNSSYSCFKKDIEIKAASFAILDTRNHDMSNRDTSINTSLNDKEIGAIVNSGHPSSGTYTNSTKGKKYTTGYGFFFREHHHQLLSRDPYATFSELSKVIASRWRRLSRDQKQVYRDRVKKKPFSTSYGKFFRINFKQVKETNPEATFGQISSLMSKKWDALTWHERKLYERSNRTSDANSPDDMNVDSAYGTYQVSSECRIPRVIEASKGDLLPSDELKCINS